MLVRRRYTGVAWACLEPDFMLHNRELWPGESCGASNDGTLENISHLAQRQLRRAIGRTFFGREHCVSARRFVRPKLEPSGWFSTVHGLVKPLMWAARSNRVLLAPHIPEFAPAARCEGRDLSCFFAPMAGVNVMCSQGSSALPYSGALGSPVAPQVDPPPARSMDARDTKFIRRESPAYRQGVVPPSGWFVWTAQAISLIMRPSRRAAPCSFGSP